MIYDLLSILLILLIILTSIIVIKNMKLLLEDYNLKLRRGKFIKKLERDTEDLSVDGLLKEVEVMTNGGIQKFRGFKKRIR